MKNYKSLMKENRMQNCSILIILATKLPSLDKWKWCSISKLKQETVFIAAATALVLMWCAWKWIWNLELLDAAKPRWYFGSTHFIGQISNFLKDHIYLIFICFDILQSLIWFNKKIKLIPLYVKFQKQN